VTGRSHKYERAGCRTQGQWPRSLPLPFRSSTFCPRPAVSADACRPALQLSSRVISEGCKSHNLHSFPTCRGRAGQAGYRTTAVSGARGGSVWARTAVKNCWLYLRIASAYGLDIKHADAHPPLTASQGALNIFLLFFFFFIFPDDFWPQIMGIVWRWVRLQSLSLPHVRDLIPAGGSIRLAGSAALLWIIYRSARASRMCCAAMRASARLLANKRLTRSLVMARSLSLDSSRTALPPFIVGLSRRDPEDESDAAFDCFGRRASTRHVSRCFFSTVRHRWPGARSNTACPTHVAPVNSSEERWETGYMKRLQATCRTKLLATRMGRRP